MTCYKQNCLKSNLQNCLPAIIIMFLNKRGQNTYIQINCNWLHTSKNNVYQLMVVK